MPPLLPLRLRRSHCPTAEAPAPLPHSPWLQQLPAPAAAPPPPAPPPRSRRRRCRCSPTAATAPLLPWPPPPRPLRRPLLHAAPAAAKPPPCPRSQSVASLLLLFASTPSPRCAAASLPSAPHRRTAVPPTLHSALSRQHRHAATPPPLCATESPPLHAAVQPRRRATGWSCCLGAQEGQPVGASTTIPPPLCSAPQHSSWQKAQASRLRLTVSLRVRPGPGPSQ